MAHIYFNASLKLRFPTASPPRREEDPHLHVYYAKVDLDGSYLTVMVPVPSRSTDPMYAHDTQAQVMGPADLIGDTIFMKAPGVTVIPSDQPLRCEPFVLFKASTGLWKFTVFTANIAGGALWPPSASLRCFYDPENEHLHGLEWLPELTKVIISGNLTGIQDGVVEVNVHDLSFDSKLPPCNANILTHAAILSPDQRRAMCAWLATYYPYGEPVANADANDGNPPGPPKPAKCAARAIPPAVKARGNDRAATPAGPAVGAQAGATAAGPDMAPAAVQVGTAPADQVAPPDVVAAPGVQADAESATFEVPSGPRCTAADEAAIRLALAQAFAFRDEGPIGQSPIHSGHITSSDESASCESELSSDEDESPSPKMEAPVAAPVIPSQGEVRKPSFSVRYPGREVIDLTADSDDEGLFVVPYAF